MGTWEESMSGNCRPPEQSIQQTMESKLIKRNRPAPSTDLAHLIPSTSSDKQIVTAIQSSSPSRPGLRSSSSTPTSTSLTTSPRFEPPTPISNLNHASHPISNPLPIPKTSTEQYWAARAVASETLLQAKDKHYREMKLSIDVAEYKRKKELAAMHEINTLQQTKLEKLIVLLLLSLAALVLAFLWIINSYHTKQLDNERSRRSGWGEWFGLPSGLHFTIPILSPFASVVETDNSSSVLGTRTFTIFFILPLLLALCIGYLFLVRRYPQFLPKVFGTGGGG